jgi:hypothetical protein
MLKPLQIFAALAVTVVLVFACSKDPESAPAATNMADYYPLVIGKYITYKLDSTVYTNLGTIKVVRSYIVRDYVDSKFKDNLGNDTYRIRRMMRDAVDTTIWRDNATFLVTPTLRTTEFMENNLRFIKLINPVREFTAWQGNSYINVKEDFYNFYENWEYFYEKVNEPYTANGKFFDSTITVNQVDYIDSVVYKDTAKIDLTNYKFKFRFEVSNSSEVYAKGVGLIQKQFLHELWQPSPINAFERNSYGVKLTLLDHN